MSAILAARPYLGNGAYSFINHLQTGPFALKSSNVEHAVATIVCSAASALLHLLRYSVPAMSICPSIMRALFPGYAPAFAIS